MPFSLEAPASGNSKCKPEQTLQADGTKSLQLRMDVQNVMNHAELARTSAARNGQVSRNKLRNGIISRAGTRRKGGSGSGNLPRNFQLQAFGSISDGV
jgi:hypothetical protein